MLLSGQLIIAAGAFILGLVFGSFATALIHRIPAGEAWAFPSFRTNGIKKSGEGDVPRSACPSCRAMLRARDLVPLLSWLSLRGKCRYCSASIGWFYPSIEVLTAFACMGLALAWGDRPVTLVVLFAVPLLVAMAVIDLRHYILPDILNLLTAVLGCLFLTMSPEPYQAFLAGAGAAALYACLSYVLGALVRLALKRDALGMGDVKFFAVAGLWLGIALLPHFLILSGILGVILGGAYRIVTGSSYFPFGPALVAAFYVLLILRGLGLI